jgi:cytochrome c-type biogenesis protein CcmH/NrfG
VRGSDIAIGLLPVVAVLVLIVWPGSDARWLANRAALEQTRSELGHFRFPFDNIQDELRRNGTIDLQPAIHLYQAALERDPNNVTALRRLAQIELSKGDIAGAQQKLETAYQLAPGQRATRQMLGEVYAVGGDIDRAAALWRTVDNQANQLVARLWWYKYIQDAGAAAHIATVLQRLNIPAN